MKAAWKRGFIALARNSVEVSRPDQLESDMGSSRIAQAVGKYQSLRLISPDGLSNDNIIVTMIVEAEQLYIEVVQF